MVTLNLFVTPDHLWVFYSLGGWGIGLAIHAFDVLGTSKGWEARKMQELTGWKDTQDELERLRERTEVLLSILTNVSWEKLEAFVTSPRFQFLDKAQQ